MVCLNQQEAVNRNTGERITDVMKMIIFKRKRIACGWIYEHFIDHRYWCYRFM